MKQIMQRLKFGVLALLSVLSMVLAIIPVHEAAAAGETYTWKNYNTITVSGGDFTTTVDYKLVQGSNPQHFVSDTAPKVKAGCNLGLVITLTSDTSAKLSSPIPSPNAPPEAYPSGNSPCDLWCPNKNGACYPNVDSSYNGQTVAISGVRGPDTNQTETDLQREVVVVVNSPNPNSSSPGSITITIKDSSGKVVATATPSKEPGLGSTDPTAWNYVDPSAQPVYYLGDFHLDPGDYTVCADIVISDCRKFTKVKFQSLNLQYGDDSTVRTLTVNIDTTYMGGPKTLTAGPYTVTMHTPGGSTVSQQTDSNTHTMTQAESQVQDAVTVTYDLYTSTTFNGLDPATYQICVEGVTDCQDVTKVAGQPASVTFRIDYNAFNADNSAVTDCSSKYSVMGVKAVTYLICSVIDTGAYAVGALDSAIGSLLTVDTKDIFNDTNGSNPYHLAWNSFRVFALGLLVIAALVMLVSQAADLDIVSAYTVRKILPRLLFAIIFIALSWDILELLCNLSNDAGNGMRELIYAPFKSLPQGGDIGGGSLFVLTLVGTGGALALGWIGLLSFVVTGVIASLTAIIVLVLRKMVIMIVIMMAPFAAAAAVLPNTRKLYDVWKETLVAVIVVFPIITSFIAIGRVFSAFAFNAPGNQTINQLIAVIAYFGPYFLITRAFKMAGGLVERLGGMADRQTKSLQGRLTKFRGNKINENMAKMGNGQRFQGSNPLARAFNATTFGATTYAKSPSKGGFLVNRDVRKAALAQQRAVNAMKYKDQPWFKAVAHNDPALRAQTYASAAEARAGMQADFGMSNDAIEKAISSAKANGGFGRNQQLAAVNQLFATGTGYDNLPQALKSITRVAGDNTEMAMGIIGEGNFTSGEVGRGDLKVSFGQYANLYSKMQRGESLTQDDVDDAYLTSAMENDSNTLLHGKPRVAQNLAPALERQLTKARIRAQDTNLSQDERDTASEQAGRMAGLIEQFQQNANLYSSPAIREHVENVASADHVVDIRNQVEQEASQTVLQRNPTTGRMEQVTHGADQQVRLRQARAAGDAVAAQNILQEMARSQEEGTFNQGQINNNQNDATARGYNQTRPRRPGQP
jgi:type IV secretory pathway VirB6-like protein